MSQSPCTRCASTGPALLPVRYAVVTDNIRSGIPGWATPASPFPQGEGYDYAIRALRQGFVYVYYESNEQWDGWSVCEDGSLWKQPSAAYARLKKTPDCTSPEHNATNVEMMVLREDALLGNIWIAFSPSKWSLNTLERYTKDKAQREKRMQCLASWQWSEPAGAQGVTAASPGSIENILDYQPVGPGNPTFLLPYNPPVRRISRTEPKAPWYTFDEKDVKPQGTIYPWSKSRAGNTRRTYEALRNRGKGKNRYGKEITPLVMALNDPIGIAHELAGFGDDFAGLHKAWMEDLSIEFMTLQSLSGAENQIQQMAKAQAEQRTWDKYQSVANYGMDKISGIVGNVAPAAMSQRQFALNELMQKAGDEASLKGEKAFATSWDKYKSQLNHDKIDAFNHCYKRFCSAIASKLESLATLRVAWLKQEGFILCCQDFYSVSVMDNLSYREAVDYGMASLNLTDHGSAFLDDLFNKYSAHPESNIVWRSLLLNNPDVINETASLLQLMSVGKAEHTTATETSFIDALRNYMGKFVDAYDKANEVIDEPPSGNSSFSSLMLVADRRLSTLGQRAFRLSGADFVLNNMNMLLRKTIFSVAAGVPIDKVQELCLSDIRAGASFREQLALAMQVNKSSNGQSIYNDYKNNFDTFARTIDGEKSIRASRIKLLILFFNGMEFAKQLSESKWDAKSISQISTAFLGTLSTATDLVEPLIRNGIGGIQQADKIKTLGGGAGVVASVLSLGLDGSEALNELFKNNTRWSFIGMCSLKSVVSFSVLLKSSSGLLKLLIDRGILSGRQLAVKVITKMAAWEIIAWAASWEAMIFIVIVGELYSTFIDNELQRWVRECVFGSDPQNGLLSTESIELKDHRNKEYKNQTDNFGKALGAVL
jgi:hypothetical protein